MQNPKYGPFEYSAIIDRKPVFWPNGKKLAVWIIPNIEFYPYDDEYHMGIPGIGAITPNILEWSRRDYGNRVGVFRMMDVLAERDVRATVALNSEVCIQHPRILERCAELGWELMGHGETNTVLLCQLEPEQQRQSIVRTLKVIEDHTGQRPRGWLGPGLTQTAHTLEHLAAEGIRYVADFVNDDQPYYFNVGKPPLLSIPYTIDLNDTQQMNRRALSADAFADLIKSQFDVLYEESQQSLRVMAIALHPWISGFPHSVKALRHTLDYIAGHADAWFATGSEIIDAFESVQPA